MSRITATEASENYNESWCLEDPTRDEMYEPIRNESLTGSSEFYFAFDSSKAYDEAWESLTDNGFNVNPYNGGDDIIEVSF